MNILIAGASGFIGTKLVKALKEKHVITVLGRDLKKLERCFSEEITLKTWDDLSKLDPLHYEAIINLAGYNIAEERWNQKVKKIIIQSRLNSNHQLIQWLNVKRAKPHFICANAVGIYGLQNNDTERSFDENSSINKVSPVDFLSEIGIHWENSLKEAVDARMPVTTIRLGVVLGKRQGFLKKILPAFYFGFGSILGDGKQTISWVHIDDVIGSILFLLDRPELTGPFNITSPNPVSQETFARLVAKTLGRPLFLRIPSKIIHLLFGEMGDCLLLKGQRVIPKRLLEEGYKFSYSECSQALEEELL